MKSTNNQPSRPGISQARYDRRPHLHIFTSLAVKTPAHQRIISRQQKTVTVGRVGAAASSFDDAAGHIGSQVARGYGEVRQDLSGQKIWRDEGN